MLTGVWLVRCGAVRVRVCERPPARLTALASASARARLGLCSDRARASASPRPRGRVHSTPHNRELDAEPAKPARPARRAVSRAITCGFSACLLVRKAVFCCDFRARTRSVFLDSLYLVTFYHGWRRPPVLAGRARLRRSLCPGGGSSGAGSLGPRVTGKGWIRRWATHAAGLSCGEACVAAVDPAARGVSGRGRQGGIGSGGGRRIQRARR